MIAPDVMERAGALLRRHIGLREEPTLQARLARAIAEGAASAALRPEAYLDRVAVDPSARQDLLDLVTVQETSFFRHPDHFVALADHVLPAFDRPVLIWSAGCSNGQEPYSLAMVLAERRVDGRVLATDVSTSALRRTREGRYLPRELAGLSEARLAAHGHRVGGRWEVAEAIRRRVDVESCNLLGSLPAGLAECQVVFCRNVLIYFTPEHAAAFLRRLADALPQGAYVFLGGAETMWQMSDRFLPVRAGGTFIYRLRERGDGTTTTAPPARRRVAPEARPPIRAQGAPASTTSPRLAPVAPPADLNGAAAEEAAQRGREAMASGDLARAVQAFRQWAYLQPGDAMAHLHLGLALDEVGDRPAANRAYERSRQALLTAGSDDAGALEGFGRDEILRLLDAKRARS